jgi:hypothetical protein
MKLTVCYYTFLPLCYYLNEYHGNSNVNYMKLIGKSIRKKKGRNEIDVDRYCIHRLQLINTNSMTMTLLIVYAM